jgi:hypothetical protein
LVGWTEGLGGLGGNGGTCVEMCLTWRARGGRSWAVAARVFLKAAKSSSSRGPARTTRSSRVLCSCDWGAPSIGIRGQLCVRVRRHPRNGASFRVFPGSIEQVT